jgi:hypothetical protein
VEIIMKSLMPRHIQEVESDRRSIKDGWYATDQAGQVCSGRFPNREDYQAHIEQECLLAAQVACQAYDRNLHLSMATSSLSLARRDEAMANLLASQNLADPPKPTGSGLVPICKPSFQGTG